PNAKSSLHKAHLAPDAGLQAPGASLSFAQGSHDFESLAKARLEARQREADQARGRSEDDGRRPRHPDGSDKGGG
ncbi:hypothetical protein, partial [Klebsiella variicola]|uniref:hypothetical protein n=1 Tax=Klebsiella variicola TaxID=244366 RepID=UPI00295EEF7B